MKVPEFNTAWVQNRRRYRKTLNGNKLILDEATGYMTPVVKHGFNAAKRRLFIERLRICKQLSEVCRSIPVHISTIYDAIAIDPLFRQHVNEALKIEGRKLYLDDALDEQMKDTKNTLLADLIKKAKQYEKQDWGNGGK